MIFVYSGIILLLLVVILLTWKFAGKVGGRRFQRKCPVCGRTLDQDDRVFADEITRENRPSELKIKGCTHCYKR